MFLKGVLLFVHHAGTYHTFSVWHIYLAKPLAFSASGRRVRVELLSTASAASAIDCIMSMDHVDGQVDGHKSYGSGSESESGSGYVVTQVADRSWVTVAVTK
jgi:hypothetical protein